MKSFAKLSLLFALVICGRYIQPAAFATQAPSSAPSVPTLPLTLTHYSTPSQKAHIPQPPATQPKSDYFL